MINQIINYFSGNLEQYLQFLLQHVGLSGMTLFVAVVIGVPLGYMSYKNDWLAEVFTSAAQALRIIPSLAVLFILIPIIGTGELPALIALIFLAIPPIIINTILGFREIPAVIKEVGLGMGMNSTQMMVRIEFPLALPYILNGIKLALVEVIASATLATYIGAGGLGTLIFTGLGLYRMDLIIIGGSSVAMLSLLSMFVFDFVIGKVSERNA